LPAKNYRTLRQLPACGYSRINGRLKQRNVPKVLVNRTFKALPLDLFNLLGKRIAPLTIVEVHQRRFGSVLLEPLAHEARTSRNSADSGERT
jgi:hypothetical protein